MRIWVPIMFKSPLDVGWGLAVLGGLLFLKCYIVLTFYYILIYNSKVWCM